MSITLTLVGRTNVGKSTLFNCLTKSKAALTSHIPNATRDRRYGSLRYDHQTYTLVDTGGLYASEDPLAMVITQQAQYAIQQADYIGLVVDGRMGLVAQDERITSHLRSFNKPILIVINKVEGQLSEEQAISEFSSLGLPLYPVSALQGRGLLPLLSTLSTSKDLATPANELCTFSDASNPLKVTLIGRPNVGKSTLVNRLIKEQRQIVSDQAGTTRDSIEIHFNHQGQQYILIDTAGIRRAANRDVGLETDSVHQSLNALESSVAIGLVIDATSGLTDQDLRLLQHIIKKGRAIVLLCNKWDNLNETSKLAFQTECKRRLRFAPFVKVAFISSLYGIGLSKIMPLLKEAYTNSIQKLSTPKLTRLLKDAQNNYAPPRVTKLRYAHPGGYNPPIIIIHGTHVKSISATYKRYLHNFYQKQLAITGTPLKLQFIEKHTKQ